MTKPKKRRTQRDLFEYWAERHGFHCRRCVEPRRDYFFMDTQFAWDVWKACDSANRRKRT